MGLAFDTFNGAGICETGNSRTIDDTGCTINFTCNDNTDDAVLPIANFLITNVAQAAGSTFSIMSDVDNGPALPLHLRSSFVLRFRPRCLLTSIISRPRRILRALRRQILDTLPRALHKATSHTKHLRRS